jgi:hypothetical protein
LERIQSQVKRIVTIFPFTLYHFHFKKGGHPIANFEFTITETNSPVNLKEYLNCLTLERSEFIPKTPNLKKKLPPVFYG